MLAKSTLVLRPIELRVIASTGPDRPTLGDRKINWAEHEVGSGMLHEMAVIDGPSIDLTDSVDAWGNKDGQTCRCVLSVGPSVGGGKVEGPSRRSLSVYREDLFFCLVWIA